MEQLFYSSKVAKNSNLCNEIFSFSSVKDYSQIAQTCTSFNRLVQKYDPYYKDDCNNFFFQNTINNQ